MVNDILDAVTTQLGLTFGDGYKYYMENVEQNFTPPCFTVDLIQPTIRSRSPVLYDRAVQIVVHYFNDDRTDIKRTAYSISEDIIACLEYLPFKHTLLRGENRSWQLVDDVLQVFVTYNFMTMKNIAPEDNMTELASSEVTPIS